MNPQMQLLQMLAQGGGMPQMAQMQQPMPQGMAPQGRTPQGGAPQGMPQMPQMGQEQLMMLLGLIQLIQQQQMAQGGGGLREALGGTGRRYDKMMNEGQPQGKPTSGRQPPQQQQPAEEPISLTPAQMREILRR